MNTAIILAAGAGSRMQSDTPKQFLSINNKMIIEYSIDAFSLNNNINQIIVVCNRDWTDIIREKYQSLKIVDGGKTRTESSFIGLSNCDKHCSKVLIHDAARPFISQEVINSSLNYLGEYDCAIPVIECEDSIISLQKMQYLEREKIKIIQTPQAFNYQVIKEAYDDIEYNNNHVNETLTDNLSAVLKYNKNVNVKLFDGEKTNFKITKEDDLAKAKLLV